MINFINLQKLKKTLAKNKIFQMKETAIKEIKNNSIRLAVDFCKKINF